MNGGQKEMGQKTAYLDSKFRTTAAKVINEWKQKSTKQKIIDRKKGLKRITIEVDKKRKRAS